MLPATFAGAAVTELRNHYWAQTRTLPATAVLTAPSSDGSYILTIALEDISCSATQGKSGNFVIAIIHWIDENGVQRAYRTPNDGTCTTSKLLPMRVKAATAPTLETTLAVGPGSCLYNLFVDGFGFSALTQGQAGIAEPVQLQWLNQTSAQTLSLTGISSNLFLISVLVMHHGVGGIASVLTWWGDTGMNQAPASSLAAFIHAGSGQARLQISGDVSQGYDVYVRAVTFGIPGKGMGPLTDYEYKLLDWNNATYPARKTIFVTGNQGANILLSSNIAEEPNPGNDGMGLFVYWSNQLAVPCAAAVGSGLDGAPGACSSPALIAPNSPVQLQTYNTDGSPWGASPTYSAEVNVIQF